ncbi:MAG: hypothetical protein H0V17_04595 [Deltaproteobacteria bacterium]|nr:hypothetical protein [Deltaproteobacteria bacterium]
MKTTWLALAAFGVSCGGGMDEPPLCPTGDCTPPTRTVVKWTFNVHPEMLFPGDTCQDLEARNVRVDLASVADPATIVETKEVECNQAQASFLALAPGDYIATITPLDRFTVPMLKTPVMATLTAGTADVPTTAVINVPWDSWLGAYTGTFLFRLAWAGASCEAAVPTVVTQTLTLMVDGGTVATATTDVGQKLDGSDPKPCRKLGESFAQFAEGLPFGPATLTVIGKDALGEVAFDNTFDAFIGAAKNNPTITFDVPAPPPPDAGVDAPMD